MEDSSLTDPTLPTELITEILSRLPVKTLVRFRSVSKSWLALVSSPEFVKTHLSVSANNKDYTHHRLVLTAGGNIFSSREIDYFLRDCSLSSLRNDSVTEAFRLNYPMNKPHKSVTVVGSVNGLICLAIDDIDLFLWNPSVRRYKNLPHPRPTVYHFGWFKYGFGYDESNDDYKIVGIFRNHDNERLHHVEIKIYSLKSNSWRSKSDIPDEMRFFETGKFVNGKLHWAGELHWPNNWAFHKNWNIISIDLADEKWGKVEQPRYVEVDFCLELGVLGSDLSMIWKYSVSHADVWVMREYGVKESWTKMYTVKYPSYVYSSFIDPTLCMSNKGEILLVPGSTLMVRNPDYELIRYPKIVNFHSCVAADVYVESLVVPYYRTNQAHNKN
ncbi:PREDICTED: F-box/kelch-repeat protein At3g23880-like [Nicotiana attenuata]|uniref:F-boxkelch-repeat protein n=1 Tax=Nicotiana attenuata TaxID=49451 RepID=A0A1J6KCM9_NICAT|nr:PREDICTED: F-box/kelch-repeat protein At3g23880-like [Nicotiana attenuata]OIT27853.1 f-boxkelch-repeat protein [Nicotiana attenuata]